MQTVTEYLALASEAQRSQYSAIKKIVVKHAPEAEEVMSYGIPAFKYKKKPLIYFGAFAKHMSLFPAQDDLLEAVPALARFRAGKGTFQFTEADPIPNNLIEEMIKFRLSKIISKA